MKKTLLFVAVLLAGLMTESRASHLMGGQITAKNLGGLTYHVRLTLFRDSLGIPIAALQDIVYYADTASIPFLTNSRPVSMPMSLGNGVEMYFYDDTITVPAPGTYHAVFYNCCRNAAIINLPNPSANGMFLDITWLADTTNSSPDFINIPVTLAQLNQPFVFNPLPVDFDGDSLSWSLDIPQDASVQQSVGSAIPGYVHPSSDTSMPFTMDPNTGEVSMLPNQLGNFVCSVICHEYRNGVQIGYIRRDMQFIVVPSANTPAAGNMIAGGASPNGQRSYIVNTGTPVQLNYTVIDPDNGNLYITVTGEPLAMPVSNATAINGTGTGTATATFSWTPQVNDIRLAPYFVNFRIAEGYAPFIFMNDVTYSLRVDAALSMSEASSEAWSMYPIPASDFLTLKGNSAENQHVNLRLVSTDGRLVFEKQLNLNNGLQQTMLDVSSISNGNYILLLTGDKGMHQSLPVLIQH